MLARRFLYVFATLIVLLLAVAVAWNLFQDRILRVAFVPSVGWSAPKGPGPDYEQPAAWLAHPKLSRDPSRWHPRDSPAANLPVAAVFYVMPTTALERDHWNASLVPSGETGLHQRLFVQSQASIFNGLGTVWAPRYRQAVLGAFLTDQPESRQALDFAYRDVEQAFGAFIKSAPADHPILLVGHSQGTKLLLRLMRKHVAGTPVAKRIAAAYLVGWPISIAHDLPRLGLPGCSKPRQANCIISWQSFAEPADPHQILEHYDNGRGLANNPMLCVNPLTGTAGAATASANHGSLQADAAFTPTGLKPGAIPARCSPEGWLLIGPPPDGYDRLVFPGNNYHVFDYALFWRDTRADAERRLAAFRAR